MTAVPESTIPAKCPECGRLTVDNKRHCKPADAPGAMAHWSTKCLTMVCPCGTTYARHGHFKGGAS